VCGLRATVLPPHFVKEENVLREGNEKYGYWDGGATEITICMEWGERLLDIDFRKSGPFYSNQRIPVKVTIEWDERDIEEWYDPKEEKE
jgi:hypothetical protein